ncbi:uncharacterized protein isoform X1 [Choristoneura fumiferana]|uniref:uncharacterized protein isoform X1 n=2 Tax=Choristoneura fumiferana TaxID=7141 RepID=UPI003D15BF7F
MLKISLFVLFTVLTTMNLSLAQSGSDSSSDGSQSNHNHANLFGFPFPFDFSQLPFFGGQREAEATAPAEASAAEENSEDGDHQNRFFFNLFSPSVYVSCNSSTQAGATCTSCTTALRCGSNNVGRLQYCHGFHPYCNIGRCSIFPGELCSNSTG